MAPFTPFIAEEIYQSIPNSSKSKGLKESVHLEDWPEGSEKVKVESGKILEDMELVRKITEMGHALRKEVGIPVRQPLQTLSVNNELSDELQALIADELNVKEIRQGASTDSQTVKEDGHVRIALNTDLTPELKKEGLVREIVRAINQKRKEQKLTRDDRIVVGYKAEDSLLKEVFVDYEEDIKSAVLADRLEEEGGGEQLKIDGNILELHIEKI
jgi:isoleucyl-tRNA synthetase